MDQTGLTQPATSDLLVAGQHLDQATFHDRYERMPPGTWAELIGGVVYMTLPLGPDRGDYNAPVALWLGHYERFTPGVRVSINTSTALDELGEPRPDCSMRILPEYGGQTRADRRFLIGAPELVVEIARSSRQIDLSPKLRDYQRAGVREYLVVALEPDEIHWYIRRGDQLTPHSPGADGWYRSEFFSGLWLDPAALFSRQLNRLIEVLEQGLASPEHSALVARLVETPGTGQS